MINAYTGLPGHYKSYTLADLAYQMLNDPKETREIWTNFWIDSPKVKYYEDFLQLVEKKDIVIFMDEADDHMDARDWADLPKTTRLKFRQHRHHGIDIYLAVQDLSFLDVTIRKLVGRYFECKRLIGNSEKKGVLPKNPWGLYVIAEFPAPDYDKKKRPTLTWQLKKVQKKICFFYDTHRDISALLSDRERNNVKMLPVFVCPTCGHRKMQRG